MWKPAIVVLAGVCVCALVLVVVLVGRLRVVRTELREARSELDERCAAQVAAEQGRAAALTDAVQWRERAEHDSLTGLLTRSAWEDAALALLARLDARFVVVVDVDDLTGINNRRGHAVGDAVLVEVAARLRAHVPGGVVGRWGGDEMVAVLRGRADVAAVAALARALQGPVTVAGGVRLMVSVSVGAVGVEAGSAVTLGEYFVRADMAMLKVKRMPFVCVWPEMLEPLAVA